MSASAPGPTRGSGLNAASALLQRAIEPPAGRHLTGTYGGFTTLATAPTSPYTDTTGSSGNCYKYQYLVSDAVGNQSAAYTSTSVAKLDTQAPAQVTEPHERSERVIAGLRPILQGQRSRLVQHRRRGQRRRLRTGVGDLPEHRDDRLDARRRDADDAGRRPVHLDLLQLDDQPNQPGELHGHRQGQCRQQRAQASTITFTSDSAAPTGGSISYAGGNYASNGSVPITLTIGTDALSGVSVGASVVKRDSAVVGAGLCLAFANNYQTVTLAGGADTGLSPLSCYKYEYVVVDNVGNQAIYTSNNVVKTGL